VIYDVNMHTLSPSLAAHSPHPPVKGLDITFL
jgi:hypothetical protein